MKAIHEGIRTVSGIHFLKVDDRYDIRTRADQMIYFIYISRQRSREDILVLLKFIRMFDCSYRICLLDINGRNKVGICIYCDEDEQSDMASIMEWFVKTHKGLKTIEYTGKNMRVIGIRIANNMFHANKLVVQGEVLD